MMGRASAVISASTLRRASRTHRAVITGTLASAGDGRAARRAGTAMAVSDTGGLLLVVAAGVPGAARPLGRVACQGEKHVVERGAAHAEPLDRHPARVELVEQAPDVPGAAVGGHADQPLARIGLEDPPGGGVGDLVER